ncbi:aspartate-semialdehyde dehydrogenase [Gloeobacter kilaueensis]|uniref:Aspartate-semialdehyde dehydrogenase n=1 Tax=Gloeobacter kilaueensis (strain ATCC BAA-2537 / CCAP 1431/1 / ULC 316 / JS1) TaxID=1183438 RepID=U5QN76_GLOK1|nr:aspartate-semialdehyde dehydrogenase [Gloeobacter kilaueensis]AGY60366.1 aspartate-semialdehyde dehydrogenase [Gloeobacter kilaueensis JS1]
MTDTYRVAVLGATGAVGTEMVHLLEQRRFPLASLKLLASERSVGRQIAFAGEAVPVEPLTPGAIKDIDIVLGATEADLSRQYARTIVEAGAVFIDNSSAFRLDPDVPLVVPEVNLADLKHHAGIVANPNCSTILLVVALWPLHRRHAIRRVVVSTYQAASGAGAAGMSELLRQSRQILADEEFTCEVFPHPIAFNLFPHDSAIGADHYCAEERKLIYETRRIFHDDTLRIAVTCVRVPVLRAHSEAVNIEFAEPFALEEALAALSAAPGVHLVEDWQRNHFPMPIEASGKDPVLVGRIRQDLSCDHALDLWLSGDQLRKGAALNAVQIAEALAGGGL